MDRAPDSQGERWRCWYPIGVVTREDLLQVGLVRSSPRTKLLDSMEMHSDREEFIFALEKPLVQTVHCQAPPCQSNPIQ